MDVLVNNAGINPQQGRTEDYPMDIWDHVIRTNLTGYLMSRRRPPGGCWDGRGGSIINVSSISGASALGRATSPSA